MARSGVNRKQIDFAWEDVDAQAVFADWVGFPGRDQTATEADKIEALMGLRPPMRVLDIGCGNGRHTLEFARRGYRPVGIDVASTYLDAARNDAERSRLNVEFRLGRGSELREEEVYDFVLAYNHTLGFMSEDELAEHLRRVHRAIKPSGSFLLVLAGPKLVPGQVKGPTRDWGEKEGRFILSQKVIDDAGFRHETSIVIDIVSGEVKEFYETQKAYSLDDVLARLNHAGFRSIEPFRDLDGQQASPESFGVFACLP